VETQLLTSGGRQVNSRKAFIAAETDPSAALDGGKNEKKDRCTGVYHTVIQPRKNRTNK